MSYNYICKACGEVINEAEIVSKREEVAEGYYENYGVCPHCESDALYEAEQCERCGEWFPIDDMVEGYCQDCAEEILHSYDYDAEGIYKVTKGETEHVDINSFLASVFSDVEIEDILLDKAIERAKTDKQFGLDLYKFDWYIREDKEWFLEHYTDMKEREAKKNATVK